MDDDFQFDDGKSSGIPKKALVFACIALGFSSILALLIGSSMLDSAKTCSEVSEATGIDRCESDEHFEQVFFVVGDTANTAKPMMSDTYSRIIGTMFDVDGKKSKDLFYISVSDPKATPKQFNVKKKGADKVRREINDRLQNMHAKKDGADYLEAIRNAALHAKNPSSTLIYILGSGLSDSGILNFAEKDLLISYTDESIQSGLSKDVKEKTALEGVTIVWEGLGETASPQESLGVALKSKEMDIYAAALSEFGINESDFHISKEPYSSDINDAVKSKVKTTPVTNEDYSFEYKGEDSDLAFVPGKADFVNTENARKEVQRLVEKYRGATFVITPYQSRGRCNVKSPNTKLLSGRAEATRDLFVEAGASSVVVEDGKLGDMKECPRGYGNYFVDESVAPNNRKVVISVVRR